MKFFFLLSLFALVSGANFAITTTFQGPSCNSSLAVSSDVRVLDKCVSDGGRYLRFTCQDGILSILTYKNPTCSLTPTVAKKTLGCSASASGLYTSIVCSPNFPALLNVSSVIVRYSAPAVEKCKYNFLTRFTVAYNDTTGICARNPVRCSNTGKNSSETRVCKKDFQISDFIPSSSTSFSSRGNTTLITRSSVFFKNIFQILLHCVHKDFIQIFLPLFYLCKTHHKIRIKDPHKNQKDQNQDQNFKDKDHLN
eukprot:TRINITY_DN3775_c0_g1_i3.p1 TRINITY_DN3775_c0_g1~~TRINITY_DN3775_c0_g1_i3.p1  ORF type:complete len:253 (+),score=50.22 TRINITY_DN3775_c0_g1_i3:203-961(+)